MIKNQSQLTAALIAVALILSCGNEDDGLDVSVSISDITKTETTARITVNYSAGNASVTEVGIVYGATPGRLNIRTIISSGEPNVDYGVVSTPASVSGKFYADLENLADGTKYFAAPFVKLDKASPEFPDGYFLPSGYKEFETKFADGKYPPALSAVSVANITYAAAALTATVENLGNPQYIRHGFCYGTSAEPMQDDGESTCVPVYTDGAMFSETITDLTENTAYNVRAYASNNRHPTQYGKATAFKTLGGAGEKLVDERDGREYRIAEIGRFTWMAENLNYNTANSWCYNDDESYCEKYGRLYTQAAASAACPAGWRLPTNAETENLTTTAGGAANAGKALKSAAWDGTDNFAFTALPGGYRDRAHVRIYLDEGTAARWWNIGSTQTGSNAVSAISGSSHEYSVRCIKIWQ